MGECSCLCFRLVLPSRWSYSYAHDNDYRPPRPAAVATRSSMVASRRRGVPRVKPYYLTGHWEHGEYGRETGSGVSQMEQAARGMAGQQGGYEAFVDRYDGWMRI